MSLEEVDWNVLPQPEDDGAANHLTGTALPVITLSGTAGKSITLASLRGRSVIYMYPMTGRPDTPLPNGWNMIPGARGCTPQSCAFCDHMKELKSLGVDNLFGVSTQDNAYQQEAATRLHLPYPLLSDENLELQKALNLPTMRVEGKTLLKRLTMIVDDGIIKHTMYPVFPPDKNVEDVIHWLTQKRNKSS